ncbi:Bacterial low temperature requirement A protein (LtrA) [Streptomyces sp. ADI96-02]|uniref:low temperature requirement protein A n=1 Tax=Streptomyces sp. ADI96-02 TaxID=1522760 RepID=UPI000F554EF4|nr:low temperature requirement protein A [Streptomyces sp. ADI96-02]RPK68197.1 Bacterial low temperature requirement A protein (LtrA) [Streptomyces sp. ADI96-02]
MSTHRPPVERHASWIELFFDLVVVAGVLQLSHLLHDGTTFADLGLYAVLFLAFWIAWVCFTVYGNVEGEQAWTTHTFLLAMPGLGVMVSAVPGIRTDHAVAFALAYVFLRWLSGRLWRPGRVVVDWPLVHLGGGTLPWIVSLWTDPPLRYWLWAAGLAFDLLIILTASGSRLLRRAQEQIALLVRLRGAREHVPAVEAAYPDLPHLVERLGLFVIIVLGEGVIQITSAAGSTPWDMDLAGAGAGAFVLLIGVWTMSLRYGSGGVPRPGPRDLPVRLAVALHWVTSCSIAALATGLGLVVAHPHGSTPQSVRLLLCGSLAVYFAVGVLAARFTGARLGRSAAWAAPCLLLAVAPVVFAGRFGPVWLIWLLVLAVGWQILCVAEPFRTRRHARAG